ncbi:type I-C CRISPR-associated endonuclease Cas1c [Tundrisphaera sp. TA3]|uniref:type I-C CRISPR-associated endonuclease Cas1c n=1 Tax=Tundrisphaera sp. TA3 TaxID=3435775 RepID=UPI003EBE704D
MKTHLNTLYVMTQGTYLGKKGETVQVRDRGKVLAQLPLNNLEGIVCFGRVACSPSLLGACAERGVAVSLLTERGRFLASVRGFSHGNVLLRRQQYRLADRPESAIDVSRRIATAKVTNSRSVLLRGARDSGGDASRTEVLDRAAGRLAASVQGLRDASAIDQIRGLEGEAATHYFGAFNALLSPSASAEAFQFQGRSRRPPLDRINALLSFLYTLLLHDARAACESVGLDSCVGFLHADRSGKPSLALDLMEEFRAPIADRLAFSMINRRQIDAGGFKVQENGAVEMNDATRKAILAAYQQRKREALTHPVLGEPTTIGLLLHLQALLMARWIRGDVESYYPFLWKG